MDQHLFLFGGSPPFGRIHGKQFASLCNQKKNGHVAIFCLNRKGWQTYMPKYQHILEEEGVTDFRYYLLEETKSIRSEKITGIIICGGDTLSYHHYIVTKRVGEEIKQLFQAGVPIAGFSAGALICSEYCMVSPSDYKGDKLMVLNGLGILQDYIIAAHYTKWNERQNLLAVMTETKTEKGLGLDDEASVYLKNGHIESLEGKNVHILD
ncbi:Type 1 glutamine amidotransferase-like domain-containing protein [Cytobacillus kochii]|uniref:Type 1 glutamine amidotransferase-like domain-containing protein n=1 Tax=Cytobacillus kochii TaxID=859143 RepID=UPI00402AA0E3